MPYSENVVGDTIDRVFSADVDDDELVWHRDKQDRTVNVTAGQGWWFQFDNEMPFRIGPGTTLKIPAMTYHRILRQSDCTELRIRIEQSGKPNG